MSREYGSRGAYRALAAILSIISYWKYMAEARTALELGSVIAWNA